MEIVWNSVLMNEISYVDKNHSPKKKYVRNIRAFFVRCANNDENIEKKIWETLPK